MTGARRLRAIARRLGLRRPQGHVAYPRVNFGSGLGEGAWLLFGLVHAMRPSVCVEIGSARGQSTCYIGMALKRVNHGHLYAIDPHQATAWNDVNAGDTYSELRRNLRSAGVDARVTIVRRYSSDAAKDWTLPIDLLFIDGDHSYDGVKRDWDLFAPHVREFGLVVFHDTLWERSRDPNWRREDMGVPRFVDELRRRGFPVITFDQHYGISAVQPVIGGVPLIGPDSN
ncbi:MAG TPA: class I SAM-dependent methyltransferase [Vicinamibacterales bacterium]